MSFTGPDAGVNSVPLKMHTTIVRQTYDRLFAKSEGVTMSSIRWQVIFEQRIRKLSLARLQPVFLRSPDRGRIRRTGFTIADFVEDGAASAQSTSGITSPTRIAALAEKTDEPLQFGKSHLLKLDNSARLIRILCRNDRRESTLRRPLMLTLSDVCDVIIAQYYGSRSTLRAVSLLKWRRFVSSGRNANWKLNAGRHQRNIDL
jgi:hypothetical protein